MEITISPCGRSFKAHCKETVDLGSCRCRFSYLFLMRKGIKIIAAAFAGIFLLAASDLSAVEPAVVTAEGTYVMGDLDSKKDAKMLALIEAKRIAVEKAGTYVESSSEVKNYVLTKDQITTLAAGIMSVDILKEDWTMSGQNLKATIIIRATIETTNLRNRIAALYDEEKHVDDTGEIRKQLAALQKELADLKAKQSSKTKEEPAGVNAGKERHDKIVAQMSALDYLEEGNKALEAGREDQAFEAFKNAISLNPSLADAHAGQAIILQKRGRSKEAMAKIDEALKIDKNSPRNYAVKGRILSAAGKNEQALALLNKAIDLNPQGAKLYGLRSAILKALNRRTASREDIARACKLGSPPACERLREIEQKRPPFSDRRQSR